MTGSEFDINSMHPGQYFLFWDRKSGYDIVISKNMVNHLPTLSVFSSLTRSNFYSIFKRAFDVKPPKGYNTAIGILAISESLAMRILHEFFQIMARGNLIKRKRYEAVNNIFRISVGEEILQKAFDQSSQKSKIIDVTFIV